MGLYRWYQKGLKMKNIEQDNRVCIYYITDKLQRLSEIKSNKELRKEVEEFKEEMTYNLGINALHNHNN